MQQTNNRECRFYCIRSSGALAWIGALSAGIAVLAAALASAPPDQPRLLLSGLAIPFALANLRPPLADLSVRLSEPDPARVIAFVLDSSRLEILLRCCWVLAWAGVTASAVLAVSRWVPALSPGFLPELAVTPPHDLPAGSAFSAMGLAAGFAGLALPWRFGPSLFDAGAETTSLLFALGAGLLLAFATPPEQAFGLAIATALIGANGLPALLAVVALPWLSAATLCAGLVIGSSISLTTAASGLLDGPSAVLAGLLVNLAVAVVPMSPPTPRAVTMRFRLQRTLAGPWRCLRYPVAGMTSLVWVFLSLGPGWPLLCKAVGGPWRAGFIAAAGAGIGLLWLHVRSERASRAGHRA